jgi:predicted deacylase
MAATRGTLTIGPVTAAPGSVASGALQVPARAGDAGTTIPITIIHGASPGPVLALVAGVHGMEYVPVIALQRLRAALDPATLRGTIVMVHVANMPSFLGRTIYYSPVDGQNLNRVFPGRPDGTLSERIADVLTREIIARATHVIDLHGGDGNESLRPYLYWITTGDPSVADASRGVALAFGLDHIVVDDERPTEAAASMYLSNTAITRGKPAITVETGCLARIDEASLALVARGVAGVLRHLDMRDEGPAPVADPIWLTRNVVIRAGGTGLFYPSVHCGDVVAEGAGLGRVTDFHGRVVEDIHAPLGGEVLYVVATPPVTKGEPLAMVAATGRTPDARPSRP